MSWMQELQADWVEDHPAIQTDETLVSYGQLRERVARAAGWLRAHGVAPGETVALQTPRCLAFLEVHLAALGLGVCTLPLNPDYTAEEVSYILQDARPRLAVLLPATLDRLPALKPHLTRISSAGLRAELDASIPCDPAVTLPPAQPAVLLYTSGTTGKPKGALLSHDNLRATVRALHEAWGMSRDDRLLHALPLFHVHGLFAAQHLALLSGCTTRWLPRFDADRVLRTLHTEDMTVFMGVPTFYARLLALPPEAQRDLSAMRLLTSGSAPLPARDHTRFQERYGHGIVERYGMTEVGLVLSNPLHGERRPGTVGLPLPGVRARIVDSSGSDVEPGTVGELLIAGPSVFAGYLNRPDKTAEALRDGFMHTGDLACRDERGYYCIVGRSKDMIISGGLNVYPSEVEAALLEHPAVAQAAVVGVDDPDFGERVVASIVARTGRTSDGVMGWLRERLAAYKCPKAIRTLDALPRNAMGKVQKEQLRAEWRLPELRAARPDEVEEIVRWNLDMARETEGLELDRSTVERGVLAALQGVLGTRFYRVDRAGQSIGQCMITREWSDWRDAEVWWFQSVYVPPAWRRRAVFRFIYESVRDRAAAEGAAGLRLYVDHRNHTAQQAYRALGMSDGHYAFFEQLFDEPGPPTPRG